MKEEIEAGVKFLREFLAKYGQLTGLQIEQFVTKLTRLLNERYANHWYESQPLKGQAFRCLRLKRADNYIDPALEQILRECGLSLNQLGLTNDFTLWIDPGEVSVRFGDQIGYTYTIARFERLSTSDETTKKTKTAAEEVEKIFDDKLTAFIRQNSTSVVVANNTPAATTAQTAPVVDDLEVESTPEEEKKEEDLSDAVASLAIDQPQSSTLSSSLNNRRVNLSSSNISITPSPSSLVAGVQNTNEIEFG
jgi:protein Tob/BTG